MQHGCNMKRMQDEAYWWFDNASKGSNPGYLVPESERSLSVILRVRTHSQNMTVAARATADRKTVGHLS